MPYKLNNKLNILDLDGKSGKFVSTRKHLVFEGRDGSVVVLATAVKERAPRVESSAVAVEEQVYGAYPPGS